MVLNYDRNPARTTDEKLDSLMQNMQLALNEIDDRLDKLEKHLEKLQKTVDSMGA